MKKRPLPAAEGRTSPLFFISANLITNGAAGFACGLAGSLAFPASA
jgi:hypothetical protein